jgi:hypothetical protein
MDLIQASQTQANAKLLLVISAIEDSYNLRLPRTYKTNDAEIYCIHRIGTARKSLTQRQLSDQADLGNTGHIGSAG